MISTIIELSRIEKFLAFEMRICDSIVVYFKSTYISETSKNSYVVKYRFEIYVLVTIPEKYLFLKDFNPLLGEKACHRIFLFESMKIE